MSGPVTWEIINQIWPILTSTVAIILWLNRKFSTAAAARTTMEKELKDHVDKELSKLSGNVDRVEKDLLRHQRYAAENFATKVEQKDFNRAVKESIDRLGEKLDAFVLESHRPHSK